MWMLRILIIILLFASFSLKAEEVSIGKIILQGNHLISDQEIYSSLLSRPDGYLDQKRLIEDAGRIADLYQRKGILNVKIHYPELQPRADLKIDVVFRIEEIDDLFIRQFEISGNRYVSKEKILALIPAKISLINLHLIMKNILAYYNDNAFLFASIALDSLVTYDDELIAFCTIDEGEYCDFDIYRFQGNKATTANTLIKISGLQTAGKITPSVLEKAADNLRRKTYIKEAQIIPLDHKQLLISIEEDKMSLISGILGYDNRQKKSEKMTGFVNVQFLNLYGTDRNLVVLWQRLNAARNYIELSYHESGPKQLPLSADISISRLNADSTYIETTFESDAYYYSLNNKYGGYFALEDIFPGSRRPILIEKTKYYKLGAFWNYSKLDFHQNPTKGSEFQLRYYYIFHRFEGKNVSKQAVEAGLNYFHKFLPSTVLSLSLNTKIRQNKELSELEYFELGGNKNLRGFTEDQFFGFRIGWLNTELRYLLSRSSRFFIFADYGYVEAETFKLDKLFGFGIGLRILTRLGLLGLDYGFSYDGKELRNPLDGIIHFGLESKL